MRSILHILIILMIWSCSSHKKVPVTMSKDHSEMITNKRFSIISNMAYPMPSMALQSIVNAGLLPPGNSSGQINLIGNPNFFNVLGDSIAVYLPYYGEHQMGGLAYSNNNNGGIKFEGIPKAYTYESNAGRKKNIQILKYTFKNNPELSNAQVEIFPNGQCSIYINSSHRTPIRYSGNLHEIASSN